MDETDTYFGNYKHEKEGIYKLEVYRVYSTSFKGPFNWTAEIINNVLYIWGEDSTNNYYLDYVFLKID